jgi:hypothetical protein
VDVGVVLNHEYRKVKTPKKNSMAAAPLGVHKTTRETYTFHLNGLASMRPFGQDDQGARPD